MKTRNLFKDLLNLMYPRLCSACGGVLVEEEHYLCLPCVYSIPRTNYHLLPNNPVEKRFWGKADIAHAASFFHFHKGSSFQKILHCLKYKGMKELGLVLGRHAGAGLLESPAFASADIIVPVPLHPRKYQKRGYNQSEWIGRGLAEIMEKPQDIHNLTRIKDNLSQTKKSVYERYENTAGIFELKDSTAYAGKHVLLVDDVLTTGSTLEACALALLKTQEVKVSIFTLALA